MVGIVIYLAVTAVAQQHSPLHLTSPVQDKNFYVLSLMERTPSVRRRMLADPALREIARAKRNSLTSGPGAMQFTDAEIEAASTALGSFHDLDETLRASGVLVRGSSLTEGWLQAARGINRIIEVYGKGVAPRYPAIDSISFDIKSESFGRLLKIVGQVLDDDGTGMDLFFEPSLRYALALLDANHRDEAGRLEPLESGENAAAIRRIPSVVWHKYPYSAIVVPGSGADREAWSLSPYGKLRLELAVKRYRQGKAPFIIVSGGYVHPNQTAHCEAIEMKRSLIAEFGVPASAILIEPYARHTTTNIRNAARELYRYNFPFDKKALIVTDPPHSASIEDPSFAKRCLTELGYEPYRELHRTSIFDLEFLPVKDALQMDPQDPLDP